MKNIFKFLRTAVCIALITVLLIPPVSAEPVQTEPEAKQITSSYYETDGEFVRGIAPGTTGEKLCKVCTPWGLTAPAGQLATGDILTDGTQALTVIVTGDLNGDGKVTITDLLMVKSNLLGNPLDAKAMVAADVNYDSKVTITDFLRIKSNLLGLEQIASGRTAAPQVPLRILLPGQMDRWSTEGAASYITEDERIVSVTADGELTAGETEGTARVSALDPEGKVMASILVTVLEEELNLSVSQNTMHLVMGKTATVNVLLNHPVKANITWTSSDVDVATVSADGLVETVKPGVATITASLDNGNAVQVEVTVASPITEVRTERTLYKVKPGATKQILLIQTPAEEEEIYTWTSSDETIATVGNDGIVQGVDYGTVTITVKGLYSGLTAQCQVKVCDVKQVAITFDDGPSSITPQLLNFLKENDIRVTFFLVGNRMESYDDYVIRQAAEGHEIGYHSYAHAMQTGLSDAKIKSDYQKANEILKKLTGKEFTLWRTPGGNYNDRVLAAIPLPHIMWSVDTLDWKYRDSSRVYYSVVNVRDGSIVLMHDLYGTTATGAINAMREMQKGDYEFVTVTELLSRNGEEPQPGVSYARG